MSMIALCGLSSSGCAHQAIRVVDAAIPFMLVMNRRSYTHEDTGVVPFMFGMNRID